MTKHEASRTLVKSPPELWAELSDPEALCRHLGELGEIRITRADPEHTVEWRAGDSSGTVHLKPSGWGTRVTLTVTREVPPSPPAPPPASAPGDTPDDAPAPQPTPGAVVPVEDPPEARREDDLPAAEEWPAALLDQTSGWAEDPPPPGPVAEPPAPTETTAAEATSRRGFFSRLFRRRRQPDAALEPAQESVTPGPTAESVTPGPTAESVTPGPEPGPERATAPRPSLLAAPPPGPQRLLMAPRAIALEDAAPASEPQAEPEGGEVASAEQVTALLTTVLDTLGAAHHRPFSRG